jgi:hypothetical protein
MSNVVIAGNVSGTGTLTVAAPNTNSDYTLTLPANTGTILTSASTNIAASSISNSGGWSVTPSGTTLYLNYNGTNVGKLDSSGNLTVAGNVTAYGTV